MVKKSLYSIAVRSFVAIVICAASFLAGQAQENEEWIVVEKDASGITARSLAKETSKDDRALLPMRSMTAKRLTRSTKPKGHRCGGFTAHGTRSAALAELNNPNYDASRNLKLPFTATIDQQAHVAPALDLVDKGEIFKTTELLVAFGTRHFDSDKGQEAAFKLEEVWNALGAGRSDFSVARFVHPWKQNSVIATIKGAEQPDEIVIIGAHLDSLNASDVSNAPGADDDASGVAVITEALRVLMKMNFKPKRTLQFIAFAAEEVGLKGSQAIAASYKDDGRKAVSMLQMDMTGFAGSAKNMYFVSDEKYVNKELTDFLRKLIATYNVSGAHEITHGETQCGYGCSDHVSWTGVGVPSAFPFETAFEEFNQAIHTPDDTTAHLGDGAHHARFAKLGVEYLIEVGKSAN